MTLKKRGIAQKAQKLFELLSQDEIEKLVAILLKSTTPEKLKSLLSEMDFDSREVILSVLFPSLRTGSPS